MAFEREAARAPVKIGRIVVHLIDPDPTAPVLQPQQAVADIQVIWSNGDESYVSANIAEHFPQSTLNQLISFVASVRTKAIAEILP